jgi:phosphoribosylformylglycinamidine (FGAM) synthase PurS component
MEITIKIDQRSDQAKAFYEYLKTLPFIEIEEVRYNKDTEKAIKEVKSGKATKISLEDLRKQLYS